MNLREVIRSGYKVFNRMSEEKRKAHILAVQYIELLATQTNTRMEPWNLLDVFGVGRGNEIVTDKKEINKRFFAKLEEIKTKTPAEAFALEQRIIEQMDTLTRETTNREIANIKRDRDAAITRAVSRLSALNADLENAHAFEVRIMALERRESTVPQQIAQVVQENFWEFHQLNGPNLDLVTKSDIILTHKNPAASLDLRVNMGRFKVSINLQTFALKVFGHENNLDVSTYFHPHVYVTGDVCWGNAAGTIGEKLPKGELKDVLNILASVLSNYNDRNPYRPLAEFQAKAKNDAPPRDRPQDAVVAPPPGIAQAEVRGATGGTTPFADAAGGAVRLGQLEQAQATSTRAAENFVQNFFGTGVGSSNDDFLRALREAAGAVTAATAMPFDMRDRSAEAGHPRDSTEAAWADCGCRICATARESGARRREFDSLEASLRAVNASYIIADTNPEGSR